LEQAAFFDFVGKYSMLFQQAMDNQSAPNPSRNPPSRLWPWLGVLLVIVFVGFIRIRLLDMPLERDEGEYAYAGQLILQGVPPYELAYNMKLPGTYFAYALGMAAFGETPAGIHLTLLVANALTAVFVFLLARKLFGTEAGLVACASYGFMSASVLVLGTAAHATQFVVLFAVPATLLLLRAGEDRRVKTLFFSGLLYGLAFLMKQQGICFCLFGGFVVVARALREKCLLSSGFVKRSFAFGGGVLLPFALTCLAIAWTGVFSKFWFWTFTYAHSYVTIMPLRDGIQHLTAYLKATSDVALGFWTILIFGLPLAILGKGIRRQTLFAAWFGFFSFLGVAVGLYFRPHYFILALPAFAMLLGAAVVSMRRAMRSQIIFQSLPPILFATALVWTVYYQSHFYFKFPADRVVQIIYGLNHFEESPPAAQYIREHSAPDARIAVLGSEPEIYFYAHRRSATGYIYTYPLMEPQPYALKMQREMIAEIEASRPEYLVWVGNDNSWSVRPTSNLAIIEWFKQYAGNYYEITAISGINNDETLFFLQDADARNYDGPSGQFLTIYKRKPMPVAAPAKVD
jgi:4-amino-4-deoxy-L-arabinose transferase-like glycosyltransferase